MNNENSEKATFEYNEQYVISIGQGYKNENNIETTDIDPQSLNINIIQDLNTDAIKTSKTFQKCNINETNVDMLLIEQENIDFSKSVSPEVMLHRSYSKKSNETTNYCPAIENLILSIINVFLFFYCINYQKTDLWAGLIYECYVFFGIPIFIGSVFAALIFLCYANSYKKNLKKALSINRLLLISTICMISINMHYTRKLI